MVYINKVISLLLLVTLTGNCVSPGLIAAEAKRVTLRMSRDLVRGDEGGANKRHEHAEKQGQCEVILLPNIVVHFFIYPYWRRSKNVLCRLLSVKAVGAELRIAPSIALLSLLLCCFAQATDGRTDGRRIDRSTRKDT